MVEGDPLQMQDVWHRISHQDNKAAADGAILAEAEVDAASPWFSGHFPKEPILPGIAILSMITDVIRQQASEKGKTIKVSAIRRVRFRQPVRPNASLSISLTVPDRDVPYACPFKVVMNGDTICSGVVEVEARDALIAVAADGILK